MTLTEFLLARIAEDEERARTDGPDQPHGRYCGWKLHEGPGFDEEGCECGYPARALAECEAKRRIVEHHRAEPFADDPDDFYCRVCEEGIGGFHPCPTLRLLALPYADHPDYQPEWRP